MKSQNQFQSPYRYVNVVILVFTGLCNGIVIQSLSAISKDVSQYYSVDLVLVSLCALQFNVFNPLFSVVANYVLDRFNLKLGISIGCIGITIGAAIRILVYYNFYYVLLGNAVIAMSNAFILNSPAKFSRIWFYPNIRFLTTSVIMTANLLSSGIGIFMASFLVSQTSDNEQGRKLVFNFTIIQAIVIATIMSVNLIFFKGKPKSQYLELQQEQSTQNSKPQKYQEPYIQTLKKLLTNKNYLLILGSLIPRFCYNVAFSTYLYVIVSPFGFTSVTLCSMQKDIGYGTIVSGFTGIAGIIFFGILIKKYKKYKLILSINSSASIVSSCLIIGALFLGSNIVIISLVGVQSFMTASLTSGMIEYACQSQYPIGEATVAGIMLAASKLVAFGFGVALGFIVEQDSKQSSLTCVLILLGLNILTLLLLLMSKEQLKRINKNKKTLLQQQII